MSGEWYLDHPNVMRVGEELVEKHGVTAQELLYFFEKPWKWTEVWEEMALDGEKV